MGGTGLYTRPVDPVDGRISSWTAHTNRGTPSTEPGTDYYCPVGTPVRAAASGVVVDVGDSIAPATGRYVTIDLDDGRRVRYLHLSRRAVNVGQRVAWGQTIAYSGASGYGEEDWSWNVAETGGAHVHMTLWATQQYSFGRYATLDPELYMDLSAPSNPQEEDDMTTLIGRGTAGAVHVLDEFGSDQVLNFKDGGVGVDELVSSLTRNLGDIDRLGDREFDIITMFTNNRWNQKRSQIVNELYAKLLPAITGKEPVIDPALIRDAIRDGLTEITIAADLTLDDSDLDAIANRVADVQHERLAS